MLNPGGDDAELRALLVLFKTRRGWSYEELARRAHCSHGTARNYLTKPGIRRTRRILDGLLDALDLTSSERADALVLWELTRPAGPDPATVGWLTRVCAAGCAVWEMDQFTASEATVHVAIGRRHFTGLIATQLDNPPPYVPRSHDVGLRTDIAAAARGEMSAMIVLRGGSSTGKTRSLFDAIHALCPGWPVVRPRSAAAVRGLADSKVLAGQSCVLWLNELQGFLGPNGIGLSRDVLRSLFEAASRPIVVVGTMWPVKLRSIAAERDDRHSDNRELLVTANQWVRWHDVPPTLTAAERPAALALAGTDPRLKGALADPDRVGFAQTLAGAYELLQHYNVTSGTISQLLFDAAADARRLGHSRPLSAELLRAMTLALWRQERDSTCPPAGWFDAALVHATAPLRSDEGVRALIPLDIDTSTDSTDDADFGCGREEIGYDLADYLEQHLTHTRRNIPTIDDAFWAALRAHVTNADDLGSLAASAAERALFTHAEALHRAALAAGHPYGRTQLARFLGRQPGRAAEAEQAYCEAIAAGDWDARTRFANWLRKQPGRAADAEQAYREAADVARGTPYARVRFSGWLNTQPGRVADLEQVYRDAVTAGDADARRSLAGWLSERPGRAAEVEPAYLHAVAAGDSGARVALAEWLGNQPGREADAEQLYREAVGAGDRGAHIRYVGWLAKQPGRLADAEQVHQDAVDSGDLPRIELAEWVGKQPGREADAEQLYRGAVAAGDRGARWRYVDWLAKQPGRQADAEQVHRDAVAANLPDARIPFARWLSEQPGREAAAEQLYRDAVAANDPWARSTWAAWLGTQPGRKSDVEQVYREAVAANDFNARSNLATWLSIQPGREIETEHAYREAVAVGDVDALDKLATWLAKQPGREADTEQVLRDAVAAGGLNARLWLVQWLEKQPGREADTEQVYREAVACGDLLARSSLESWLIKQQRREVD